MVRHEIVIDDAAFEFADIPYNILLQRFSAVNQCVPREEALVIIHHATTKRNKEV